VKLDRPTLLAALVTLVLAAPVYLLLEWVIMHANRALETQLAAEPPSSPPPVTAAPDVALAPAPAAAPVEGLPVASVTGLLHTADGTPVPAEVVELESRALERRHEGISDARGRFSIPDVSLGFDYEVRVASDGRHRGFVRSGVQVPPEGLTLDLILEPLAGASLTGRMVDAEGAPLPGRSLLLQASDQPGEILHVTGDDRGHFRVEDAPTGRLTFTTRTLPHLEVQGPQLAPASDVDVVLVLDEGIHMLSGRVVGNRGETVAGAQLKLSWSHRNGDSLSSSTRTAVTDAVGAFFFTDLGPGPHQLVASAEGYHEAQKSYDVSWDTGEVELRLRSNPARAPRPMRPPRSR